VVLVGDDRQFGSIQAGGGRAWPRLVLADHTLKTQ
jgi:hypothetical protein